MKSFLRLSATIIVAIMLPGLPACATPQASGNACPAPLSARIANSCIVTPDTLWRGAKPDTAGAAALLEKGVRSVVNLELLHDDRDAFANARPALKQNTALDYYRIYEWEPNVVIAPALLDKHVVEFIALMQTAAKPLYVHCRSGQNRTGVMVAAYRVLQENMPIEEAISEMKGYNGIWFKQDAAYIRSLTGEHRAKLEEKVKVATTLKPTARLECSASGCTDAK